MIINALINVLSGILWVITLPIRSLPDVTVPDGISAAISAAAPPLATMGAIFPVSTLLIVFGLVVAIEAAFFVYNLIMWIIHRIPFIG